MRDLSTNGYTLDCSKRLNLLQYPGEGWSFADKEGDARSLALTKIDFRQVAYEACLEGRESSIIGAVKFERLIAMRYEIRLGDNAFDALWRDYNKRVDKSVLEWLRNNQGITHIDFFGSPLQSPNGKLWILRLYYNEPKPKGDLARNAKWNRAYDSLDTRFFARHRSALITV